MRINSDTLDFEGQLNKEKGDIQNQQDSNQLNNNTNNVCRLNSCDNSENNKNIFNRTTDNKPHMLTKAIDYLQSPSDLM